MADEWVKLATDERLISRTEAAKLGRENPPLLLANVKRRFSEKK